MKNIGILHVITDITIHSRVTHEQLARMAIAGGADTIQFRQKHGSTRQHIEMLELVKSVCTTNSVPLIVNDHADVAIAMEVDGVHFGQDDMPISLAKRILPSDMIVGASARTEDKIMEAIAAGADAVMIGSLFSGTTESPGKILKRKGKLYKTFRLVKKKGYKRIQISEIPNKGSGIAINDRLQRAAAPRR